MRLSPQRRQARRVAAKWAKATALAEWNPPIPAEAHEYLKQAYLPNTPDLQALEEAQDSIDVFLPKVLEQLRKKQGDRYFMNASESQGKLFYFFSPRQPVDAFNLTLFIKAGKAHLVFGFTPYKLDGSLDFKGMVSERTAVDPEVAGMAVMRLVRSLLAKL